MRKTTSFILTFVLVATYAFAVGQQQAATDTPEVTVFWRIGAHSIDGDNPIVQEIEKRSGVRPVFQNIPWGAAYFERLNLGVASGDLADIVMTPGPTNANVYGWASEGVFRPLDDLLRDAPNIAAQVPAEVMESMVFEDGNTYWIPRLWVAPHVFLMRDDLLDRYGVSAPQTLDEFYEAGKIIRDGLRRDGRDDAYAYGGVNLLFWARWVSAAFDLPIDRFKMIDGEWRYTTTVPESRQWVEYLKRLHDEGIMDPEFLILNWAQGTERLHQGRIAMGGFRIDSVVRANEVFARAGLDARVSAYAPPRSADGIGGYTYNTPLTEDGVGFWMTASISAASRKAEAAMQLMDYMISEDGTTLGFWGREGIEHRRTTGGRFEWLIPVPEREQLGLPMYVNFLTGEPRYGEALDDPWSDEAEEIYSVIKDSIYQDFLVVVPTNERMRELTADLGTFVNENIGNFITGGRPIDEYDAFIAEWERRGGRELLEELTREMERRGQ